MFAAVIKLAGRKDRAENPHAILIPGGKAGLWLSGGLGFLVVLAGIFVSLVPPGDSTNKILFEVELLVGTAGSILLGLILYWRGGRNKRMAGGFFVPGVWGLGAVFWWTGWRGLWKAPPPRERIQR